jgi:hypothetical protein
MVHNLIMNFKYTSTFSSVLRPLVSEEKDKYLALASLMQVGNFIPDIDTEKNIDLLPVAFNAAVVNRVNKNGDVIDTDTAIASYKDFINKPINIEHNREKIVGVILTAGFSEFGSDASLSEDQVKDFKKPFNITLGGVIWKISNPDLANKIEDSSDATSDKYQSVSASWELGFNDYNVVMIDGESKNIEDGSTISDASEIESIKNNLRAFGGSGKVNQRKFVYRKVIGNVVPLGVGLTETPAADVKGIATVKSEASMEIKEKNISSIDNLNVNTDNDNKVMKIQSVKDITDESLKQVTASQISDLIEQELKIASEKYTAEKAVVEQSLKDANEKYNTLSVAQDSLQKEIAALKASLEAVESEKKAILANEKFNERMNAFDSEYELDSETRQVLASDIAGLDDDSFAAYKNKMAVFMKSKKKNGKEKEEQKEDSKESKASVTQIVEDVADKAEKQVVNIPMTSSASEDSFFNKYKQAFDYDGFIVR